MKNIQTEEFKDIEGYEGLYEVSNLGNVKSLNYKHTGEEKILNPMTNRGGYMFVHLCKNGKSKTHKLHRLVANAFIDNPDNLPQVNHKNEDKTNNNVENLEWVTAKENSNHGTRNTRVSETLKGIFNTKCSIPVDMLTKQGELIRQFPSIHEAERWLRANGFPKAANTNIIQCCKGIEHYHTAYGFKWQYSQTN